MNHLLLRLLGARGDDLSAVVETDLEFQPGIPWSWFLALAALAVAVAVFSYRRRDVDLTPPRRRILLSLRIVALLGLVALLLRPALGLLVEGRVRQTLILLFDQSASMALADPRTTPPDQVRAAIALGRVPADGGLDQPAPPVPTPAPSRLALLQAVLTHPDLALVDQLSKGFDLKSAGFTDDLIPLPTPISQPPTSAASDDDLRLRLAKPIADALRAEGRRSAPGTALRTVLDREQGRPLGGVVLFTDGIRNEGPDPREVAPLFREAGVALHVVALGTTQPRDLQVVEIAAPEAGFARDEVPASVRLQARGLTGQTARVTLTLDGKPVDARDVTFDADGEREIPLRFTPEETGDFELAAEIAPRTDEILTANNRRVQRLRVVDDQVRVLILEQSPRWEFRYLQALLLRDRRVDLKCVLFDGEPAIARDPGSPYLEGFPARREDLFSYDLIVFGDVDPRNFTPAQLEILSDFVSRSGGSLLLLAGRRFSPWAYRDTPLERLLPVDIGRPPLESPTTAVYDRPRSLDLTPDGLKSPLLRLSEDAEENLRRWQTLAPVFWVAPVGRAKPAAQVLVVESASASGSTATPTPVMALQQYGVGESMFLGTDNTWRWRRNAGEDFFVSFWGRVVQRLAIHHLVSGSRRTQLLLDRPTATPGERVGITARLFTSAFEPLAEPAVRAEIEPDPAASNAPPSLAISLRAVPDQLGLYQAQMIAPAPGRYRIRVGLDAPAAVDFTVEDRLVEAGETAMQESTLRELASLAGGEFFREEDLARLPAKVQGLAPRVRSRMTLDLWTSPLYYLVLLAVLSTEWALRRWWHLK